MPNNTVPFTCKQCGSKQFKLAAEPNSYNDFLGAVCDRCGRRVTDDDIKSAAVQVVEQKISEILKGTRG